MKYKYLQIVAQYLDKCTGLGIFHHCYNISMSPPTSALSLKVQQFLY